MTDSTLQRIWDSRKVISERCEFDSHKIVHFYQTRQKTDDRTRKSKRQSAVVAEAGTTYGSRTKK